MQNIINKTHSGVSSPLVIGVDLAASGSDGTASVTVASMTLLLNEARGDERANCAEVFGARLEAIACFIVKNEMTVREAAEALRTEADRIRNEVGEIH